MKTSSLAPASTCLASPRAKPAGHLGMACAVCIMVSIVSLLGISLIAMPMASAAEPLAAVSPYGEAARFGGFVEGGGTGKVGEQATFDMPVGFAVDPENHPDSEEKAASIATEDGNAVYVLDRVVLNEAEGHLGYRLQKLSSTGVVLASTTLPVQSFGAFGQAHPMFGLAVDSAKHRVYALVEGLVEDEPFSEQYVTDAYSLVAWSTEPQKIGNEPTLVRAPGGYVEEHLTGASLIAGPQALEPGLTQDLVVPEGLAVNSNSTTHEVVIAAQRGIENNEPSGGPTTLQSVITEGPDSGQLGTASWTADSTVAPNGERAAGLFTTNTGSYGVDLYYLRGHISRLAEVNSTLTTSTPLDEDKSGGVDLDQAPAMDAHKTPNRDGGFNSSTLEVYAAGSPITQLSNGLYAARYGNLPQAEIDNQSDVTPWTTLQPPAPYGPFWTEESTSHVTNMGVRLFKSDGTVVTTIGGQSEGQACNLNTGQLSVAAGANESLFVLTQPNEANGNSDDQVIEFVPGGKGACPVPSIGGVTIKQDGKVVENNLHGEPVVHQAAPVTFEASDINRASEAPYEFNWDVTGSGFTLSSKMEGPDYLWPSPITEYTYKPAEIGTHEGKVQMVGDYGTVELPFNIDVLGSGSPRAQFTMPTSITEGQPATFDGEASVPTEGSAIVEYRWEFSDEPGHSVEKGEGEAQVSHTFAASGKYKVKLTIFDAVGGKSETEPEEVTVSAAAHACEVNCGGGGGASTGTTSTSATTTSTSTGPPPPPDTTVAPKLTNTQKLAIALKACAKDKKKKQRVACEKQAHKKYSPPPKKKKKKK
jgi:PKD repeat protein